MIGSFFYSSCGSNILLVQAVPFIWASGKSLANVKPSESVIPSLEANGIPKICLYMNMVKLAGKICKMEQIVLYIIKYWDFLGVSAEKALESILVSHIDHEQIYVWSYIHPVTTWGSRLSIVQEKVQNTKKRLRQKNLQDIWNPTIGSSSSLISESFWFWTILLFH